jgi:hypothetical protein
MKTAMACEILNEAARLLELTATFQARYGKQYRLKAGSPQEAWTLYDDISEMQTRVAALLDPQALEDSNSRYGHWWERMDVMDVNTAQMLVEEVGALISCCAYSDVKSPETSLTYMVLSKQSTIAGFLHPSSRMIAAGEREQSHVG